MSEDYWNKDGCSHLTSDYSKKNPDGMSIVDSYQQSIRDCKACNKKNCRFKLDDTFKPYHLKSDEEK